MHGHLVADLDGLMKHHAVDRDGGAAPAGAAGGEAAGGEIHL